MKQFVEKLKTDKAFAEEFKQFMMSKNDTIKQGSKKVQEQLNKVVMESIREFAASKGIELKDDEQIQGSMRQMTYQMCKQMDDMIVKQFGAVEGSMKQPIDMPAEMVKTIRENKELYRECLHKADKAVEEAVRKCAREMDAAVLASQKEFAEKTGYKGPMPGTEFNKAIAKKLNEVITNQVNALVELSRTAGM